MNVLDQVRAARRAGVPVLAVETTDQAATVAAVSEGLNGDLPKVQWDVVRGFRAVAGSEAGASLLQGFHDENEDTVANPVAAVVLAQRLDAGTVVFLHNAQRFLDDPAFVQAVCNVRDCFKADRRTLVLLGPSVDLPSELHGDVVTLEEPLPDETACERIVLEVHEAAGVEPDTATVVKAVAAVNGLPAFQVEQVTAMSMTPDGLVLDDLWERKRRQIERTPGLSVHRDGETFEDVGGCGAVKDFLWRVLQGDNAPRCIVRVDEIDKMLAGEGDTSGVSQDQLGTLLSYMEDNRCRGVLFLGPPGCSKSLVSKAAGTEAGIPTVELDLGACKGGLVGQSEQQLRDALRVVSSVSGGKSLWIATANSVERLNTALLRRFPVTWFFDLPDREELDLIWGVHGPRCRVQDWGLVDDRGWAGADVRNCCEFVRDLGVSAEDAAKWIVPVGVRSSAEIARLREQANGRFLSAGSPGVYRLPERESRRAVEV